MEDDNRLTALEGTIAHMHQMVKDTIAAGKQEGRDEQLVQAIIQGIQAGMADLAAALIVPKRIVRGKDNEIIGVEPVTH